MRDTPGSLSFYARSIQHGRRRSLLRTGNSNGINRQNDFQHFQPFFQQSTRVFHRGCVKGSFSTFSVFLSTGIFRPGGPGKCLRHPLFSCFPRIQRPLLLLRSRFLFFSHFSGFSGPEAHGQYRLYKTYSEPYFRLLKRCRNRTCLPVFCNTLHLRGDNIEI